MIDILDAKNKKRIIYKITNKINNKCYIGQSTRTFNERYWGGRWWDGTNWILGKELSKYGVNNFEVELLEFDILKDETLDEMERFYIKKYNSLYPDGYNFEDGGQNYGMKFSAEANKIRSEANLKRNEKDYVLFDRYGNKFEFKNIVTFANEQNIAPQNVFNVLHGLRKQTHGFALSVENFSKPRKDAKTYIIIDPQGNILEITNGKKFAESHGLNYQAFFKMLSGKNIEHKGFKLKDGRARKTTHDVTVFKYSKIIVEKNNIIYEIQFKDLKKFAQENGFRKNRFYLLIYDKKTRVAGFKFVALYDKLGNKIE